MQLSVMRDSMEQKIKRNILIVEDEVDIRMHLKAIVSSYGRIYAVESKEKALKCLKLNKITHALVDLDLEKNLAGFDVIKKCFTSNVKVAALTSHENEKLVSKALDLGASNYFDKINFFESPKTIADNFFDIAKYDKKRIEEFFKYEYITQDSSVRESIEFILSNDLSRERNILILGPSGTGKSTLAKLLHENTNPEGRFVDFNANSCPENLIESELFGHKKGAFSGADQDKQGLFEIANGGTLFLDEVGDISSAMQVKLLKVIETKEFWPVGSTRPVKSNFRLILAGNNIIEQISKKMFREDLFFRINDYVINLKPLSSRKEDIILQAKAIALKHAKKIGKGHIQLNDEVLQLFRNYEWKGNTRDLESEIKKIVDFSSNPIITSLDIPKKFKTSSKENDLMAITEEQLEFLDLNGLKDFIKLIERSIVYNYVVKKNESVNSTAKKLGVSRPVIERLLDNYQSFMEQV